MDSCGNMKIWEKVLPMLHDGWPKRTMPELEALARISTYVAENKLRVALEVEAHQKMVFEATIVQTVETLEMGQNGQPTL